MNKTFTQWNKQLDDFDGATKALPGLANDVRMWGVFAPALPALYDAVLREMDAYQVTAGELRGWMHAHEHEAEVGDPVELGKRLQATITASRRLKSVIDAYNREKAIADAEFPELAGGSLKDTPVPTPEVAQAKTETNNGAKGKNADVAPGNQASKQDAPARDNRENGQAQARTAAGVPSPVAVPR